MKNCGRCLTRFAVITNTRRCTYLLQEKVFGGKVLRRERVYLRQSERMRSSRRFRFRFCFRLGLGFAVGSVIKTYHQILKFFNIKNVGKNLFFGFFSVFLWSGRCVFMSSTFAFLRQFGGFEPK